jgi:hypothetical protein
VDNAYWDSYNQNEVAKRDAMQSAEKAIRDIESDWAANLNNINPNLFRQGAVNGIGELSSTTAWRDNPHPAPSITLEKIAGYKQPEEYISTPMVTSGQRDYYGSNGNDTYFAQMMNRFSGRRR